MGAKIDPRAAIAAAPLGAPDPAGRGRSKEDDDEDEDEDEEGMVGISEDMDPVGWSGRMGLMVGMMVSSRVSLDPGVGIKSCDIFF